MNTAILRTNRNGAFWPRLVLLAAAVAWFITLAVSARSAAAQGDDLTIPTGLLL